MEKIKDKKIYVWRYNSNDDYFPNYFKWTDIPEKFEIRIQALHPEISAIYDIIYVRVK